MKESRNVTSPTVGTTTETMMICVLWIFCCTGSELSVAVAEGSAVAVAKKNAVVVAKDNPVSGARLGRCRIPEVANSDGSTDDGKATVQLSYPKMVLSDE